MSSKFPTLTVQRVQSTVQLIDALYRWSTVLDRLKAFSFPNLESFKLDYCSDSETPDLDDPDDIQEIWVDRFLLGQTDRNPRVIPYDFT